MSRGRTSSTPLRVSTAMSTGGTPILGCRSAVPDHLQPHHRVLGSIARDCSGSRHEHHSTPVPEFLCAEETAAVLAISPSTLNRWAARREAGEDVGPPFHALGGKVRRWSTTELTAWLSEQRK